jgi:hypothetical protein
MNTDSLTSLTVLLKNSILSLNLETSVITTIIISLSVDQSFIYKGVLAYGYLQRDGTLITLMKGLINSATGKGHYVAQILNAFDVDNCFEFT